MNITQRQLEGIIILVVFTLFACLFAYLFSSNQIQQHSIRNGDQNSGNLIVGIAADNPRTNGIYFFPEKTKVSEALKVAGITEIGKYEERILDMPLSTGKSIEITSDGRINVLEMSNSNKMMMNIPININRATSVELLMVPGIGEKMAERIIQLRRENSGFRRIEELMKVRGIKEKQFAKLKKYFCADCP
jgi:competence protein ComEA